MISIVQDKNGRFLLNVKDCGLQPLSLALADLRIVGFDDDPDERYVYIVDLRAQYARIQDQKWVDLLTELLDKVKAQAA